MTPHLEKDAMKTFLSTVAATCMLAVPALADVSSDHPAMPVGSLEGLGDRSGFGLNVGVSTLGATIEPNLRISNNFGLRFAYGEGRFSHEEASDGESYSGDVKLGGLGMMADYYPMGDAFRLSAGAFKTEYSGDFVGRDISINGQTTDVYVKMRQKQDGFVPYLGMGFDGRVGKHGTLSFGAGAIFGKGFDVSASESSGMAPQASVDAEIAELRSAAEDIKVIPFARLMVGFRF